MKRTYDDIRAEATPCLGGCGKLCTHGPRYCQACEALRRVGSNTRISEAWKGLAESWKARPDTEGGRP